MKVKLSNFDHGNHLWWLLVRGLAIIHSQTWVGCTTGLSNPLARGLDTPILHPHPLKILFLTFTIQNVHAMGKNVAMF